MCKNQNLYKNLKTPKKGFTLVELLIVVAIISILAATLLPRFLPFSNQAREVMANKNIRTLNGIVEVYAAQTGHYPTPNVDPNEEDSITYVMKQHGINWTNDETGITDPWGNPYYYEIVTN